jgi:hypothetical protein
MEVFGVLGNDSQLTLVDTSSYGAPYSTVSFIRDDMKNTTILAADESVLYTVETDKVSNAHTVIYRGGPAAGEAGDREIVAELKRKDLREDRIKFGGTGRSMKMSKWIHGTSGKWSDLWVTLSQDDQ